MSAEHFAKGNKKIQRRGAKNIHFRGEKKDSKVDNTNMLMSRWYQKRMREAGRGFFIGGKISHTQRWNVFCQDTEWDFCSVLFRSKTKKKKITDALQACLYKLFCCIQFSSEWLYLESEIYIYIYKKTPWYLKSNLCVCVCLCWGKGSAFDYPLSSPAKMGFKESSSSSVQIPTGAARTHVERFGNVAASLHYLCHTTRAVLPDNGGRNSHGSDFPKTLGFKNTAPISFGWDFWDFGYSRFVFSSFCFHSERPREIKN